jgi:hypothetical protein
MPFLATPKSGTCNSFGGAGAGLADRLRRGLPLPRCRSLALPLSSPSSLPIISLLRSAMAVEAASPEASRPLDAATELPACDAEVDDGPDDVAAKLPLDADRACAALARPARLPRAEPLARRLGVPPDEVLLEVMCAASAATAAAAAALARRCGRLLALFVALLGCMSSPCAVSSFDCSFAASVLQVQRYLVGVRCHSCYCTLDTETVTSV